MCPITYPKATNPVIATRIFFPIDVVIWAGMLDETVDETLGVVTALIGKSLSCDFFNILASLT